VVVVVLPSALWSLSDLSAVPLRVVSAAACGALRVVASVGPARGSRAALRGSESALSRVRTFLELAGRRGMAVSRTGAPAPPLRAVPAALARAASCRPQSAGAVRCGGSPAAPLPYL